MELNSSGIYKIKSNIKPERIYVGSAVYIVKRFWDHKTRLNSKHHKNPKLQAHFNKYGMEDLEFIVIENCQKEKLIEREQYYIDVLKPWFNINLIAGNSLGRVCSEETKKKIRDKAIGRKTSLRTRQKMSMNHPNTSGSNNGMFGKKHKKESRDLMSKLQTGRKSWNKGLTKETDVRVKRAANIMKGRPSPKKGKKYK